MKKYIILSGALSMMAMVSCSDRTNQKDTTDSQPPADRTNVLVDTSQNEGTTIKVNDEGMSFENKEGASKTNIGVSRDSAGIEITRPK